MLYQMPDYVFQDTLSIRLAHGKTDTARGLNATFSTTGPDIKANVGRPTTIPATVAEVGRTTLQVQFTTQTDPVAVDPAGQSREVRKGDGLIWSGDGQRWNATGPLTPRTDPHGNPVHYSGTMERIA
jgi:hypothetical protein